MQAMLLACVLASSLVIIAAQPLSAPEAKLWETFKQSFGKIYQDNGEELLRQKIFFSNHQSIQEHNKLYEQGKVSFQLKMNKFGDLTPREFKNIMNGYKKRTSPSNAPVYVATENDDLPTQVDWREKGAVTGIKNQGQCGSCWAFSTTGSLEGQHFLKTGKLVSLSEQQLMDCSRAEGNEGCEGGLMDSAFDYIEKSGGLDTEESYPYKEEDSFTCKFKKSAIGATMVNYTDVKAKSENSLQSAIATIGPISVAIDAGEFSFQFYSSGIYYERSCNEDELDHGVLAVGYGSSTKGDYYIVKNSWGEDWGDKGYILMARNKNNNCGIASQASFPNV